MVEMTTKQVAAMSATDIIAQLRRAAEYQRTNKGITWEHGTDILNIVAIHGDYIADACEALVEKMDDTGEG